MAKRDDAERGVEIPNVEIAAQTMLGDLKKLVVDEMRAAPNVWQQMSEFQQENALNRIDTRCRDAIAKMVRIVSAGEKPTVTATVESVAFKGDIKCTVKVSAGAPHRHDLAESTGAQVLIVLPDTGDYMGGGDKVKPDAQQPDMFRAGTTVSVAARQAELEELLRNIAEIVDLNVLDVGKADFTIDSAMDELSIDIVVVATEMGLTVEQLREHITSLRDPEIVKQQAEAQRKQPGQLPAPGTIVRAYAVKPKSGGKAGKLPAAGMWAVDESEAWELYGEKHPGFHAREDFYVEEVEPKQFEQIGCINPGRVLPPIDEAGAVKGSEAAAPPTKKTPKRPGKRGGRGK